MSSLLRLAPLWVVVLAGAAFWNAIPGGFHVDDLRQLQRSEQIRSLDNLPQLFSTPSTAAPEPAAAAAAGAARGPAVDAHGDRPLTRTALALLYRIGGLDPLPFHIWSVILHAAVALTLFFFARGVLLTTDSDELGVPTRAEATAAALVAAVLLGVHTLGAESVNRVAAQGMQLAVLLGLLALLAYVRLLAGVETGTSRGRLVGLWLAALGAQCAALLADPIAITVPAVLVVYDVLFAPPVAARGAPASPPARGRGRRARGDAWRARMLRLSPFLVAGAIDWIARARLLPGIATGEAPRGVATQLLTQSKALAFVYLKRFLWPRGLGADPRFEASAAWREPEVLIALAVLAALVVAVVLTWRRFRITAFCAAWFLIALLPETYLGPRRAVVGDHRMYLPVAALVIPVALLAVGWMARVESKVARRAGVAAVAAVVLLLVVNTNLRNEVWRHDRGASRPGAVGVEVGAAAVAPAPAGRRGPPPPPAAAAGAAPEPSASAVDALTGGGFRMTVSPLTGDPAPAAAAPPDTAAGPATPRDLFVVAYRHQRDGRRDQAIAQYGELLEHDPDHVQAIFNLAYALIQRRREDDLERAVVLLERVRSLRPDYTEVLFRLGEAHQLRGDPERAAGFYERYLAGEGHADLRRVASQRLREIAGP